MNGARALLLTGMFAWSGWCGAAGVEPKPSGPEPGTAAAHLAHFQKLVDTKSPDLARSAASAFMKATDEELVVRAGQIHIKSAPEAELTRIIQRLMLFPSPLPVMNLADATIMRFGEEKVRAQLSRASPKTWWGKRNLCILIGRAPHEDLCEKLVKIYRPTRMRVVKLEVIEALGRMRGPKAAAAVRSIFLASKDKAEHAACFRALAGCGDEKDGRWILAQLFDDAPASVVGARAASMLLAELPAREIQPLLAGNAVYTRRAGLMLMQQLGRTAHWQGMLAKARTIPHPEVLEAIGSYFHRHPQSEAVPLLLQSSSHLNHKDFRVREAWSRALGACAAKAEARIGKRVFDLFKQNTRTFFRPASKSWAYQKAIREKGAAIIYGLGLLGTKEALGLLKTLALTSTDDVVALYAGVEVHLASDDEACVEWIGTVKQLAKQNPRKFTRAARLLGVIPHPKAVEALIDLLPMARIASMQWALRTPLSWLTGHDFGADPEAWKRWWGQRRKGFLVYDKKLEAIRRELVRKKKLVAVKDEDASWEDRHSGNVYELRSWTLQAVKRFGSDHETERAVEMGLRWLANHQDPDGKWHGTQFADLDVGKKRSVDPSMRFGRQDLNVALTGLALLAYLSADHTSKKAKSIYRETVRRGQEWLVWSQLDDGSFHEASVMTRGGFNYFHYELGIGALALSEAFAMTQDSRLQEAAQRTLWKVFINQLPGAGWRYNLRHDTDTSVVGWMAMAIKSAVLGGLDIDPRCRLGSLMWFDDICTRPETAEDPKDADATYDGDVGSDSSEEATAKYKKDKDGLLGNAAAIAGSNRIFLGYARSHPFCVGVARYLEKRPVKWGRGKQENLKRLYFPLYYFYYGSLFMFQMGGEYWKEWNKTLKKELLAAQLKAPPSQAGAFPPLGMGAKIGGQIYSTTMCILSLETYYRYLPMLWLEPSAQVDVIDDKTEINIAEPDRKGDKPDPIR